ncbi:TPA: hypothetical protein ACX6RY_002594 [Photobacterium damselae]
MSKAIIAVPSSDLYDILRGDLQFSLDEVEAFTSTFKYIEDTTGEWFALDESKPHSLLVPTDAGVISQDKVTTAWFAFWQCVFNHAENNSPLEHQALGAIRCLYFCCHNRFDIPAIVKTWWNSTEAIHGCDKLEECE